MKAVLRLSALFAQAALFGVFVLQLTGVLARHGFGLTPPWLSEAVLFAHGFVFMAAAGWTLFQGRHVCVDVLSRRGGFYRTAASLTLMICLLPFALVLLLTSAPHVLESWSLLEGSAVPGGLPGVFLLKSLLLVLPLLLLVGGFAFLFAGSADKKGASDGR